MRIADTFTSNIYITKLDRLPAKLHAERHFLSRSGALHPVAVARGSGAPNRKEQSRVGPHSSPDKLEKAARNCSQNTAAAQSNMEHGSPPAFQIPRRDGDEDEKGAVALEDNLRWTPGGVWVQETVHRLEPGGGDTDAGVRAVAAKAEADTWEASSPRWILLHGKSPFQIDDVALVLKHPITEGDLRGQKKDENQKNKRSLTGVGGGGAASFVPVCASQSGTPVAGSPGGSGTGCCGSGGPPEPTR